DGARAKLTVSGAAKVPFSTRRMLAKNMDLPEECIDMLEPDVGGGFGVRGAPPRPAGEVDRGSAREPDGLEPFARDAGRARDPVRARRPRGGAARQGVGRCRR